MKLTNCPRKSKCRLVNNNLIDVVQTKMYIKLYCKAGNEKWLQCKRYMVAEELGKCPDFVLPDTTDNIIEIFDKMENES